MPTKTHVFQGSYIVFRILIIRILNLFRISSLGFRISPVGELLFMQNKPNVKIIRQHLTLCAKRTYRKFLGKCGKKTNPNKPNSKPIQTQFQPKQTQSKPNSKPIQTQFQPKQTQSKPNQTQNEPNFSSSATSRAQTPSNRGLIFKRPARVETYDATRKITYRSKR